MPKPRQDLGASCMSVRAGNGRTTVQRFVVVSLSGPAKKSLAAPNGQEGVKVSVKEGDNPEGGCFVLANIEADAFRILGEIRAKLEGRA